MSAHHPTLLTHKPRILPLTFPSCCSTTPFSSHLPHAPSRIPTPSLPLSSVHSQPTTATCPCSSLSLGQSRHNPLHIPQSALSCWALPTNRLLSPRYCSSFIQRPLPLHPSGHSPFPLPPVHRQTRPKTTSTMAISSNVGIALVLTCVGSLSTGLGGLLVVLQKVPDIKRLGLLQGFASGLMLSLSFFDLVPNAIQAIGFAATNVWFFAGCLLFAAVVHFIPEPSLLPDMGSDSNLSSQGAMQDGKGKEKSEEPGDDLEKEKIRKRRKAVLYSGIITAVGISMHNFPEGIAVFLGSMKGLRVGISLAVAIALHNIPEGLAVALPIYYATRNRWTAFKAAALSGLAEPLAVVVVALFFPSKLDPEIIEGMLAGVGGIMAFLTLHEMLPLAFEYAGHKTAVTAAFIGMAVMSANLQLLAMTMPADVAL